MAEPSRMQNLGEILQRAGAGFQGNLAQFDATRNQQQILTEEREERRLAKAKALSQERIVGAAQDAQSVEYLLEQGKIGPALERIDSRVGFLEQLGGDPTDTLAVRDMITSGDIDGALREIKIFTGHDQIKGLIKPLVTAAERINQGELDLKRAEFEAKYGTPPPGRAPASGGAAGARVGAAGVPSAGGPTMGGTEGAKLRIEQQKADNDAQKARREQAEFDAKQRDIPEQWMKPYMDATQGELAATQTAAQLSQLAADFDAAKVLPAGFRATLNEVAKKVFGEQDTVTALRERFSGARNSQVMKNLPPGVASDKDIELAMSGYPGDSAPKENISSFLRGQVKIQALEAAYERFKVEHIDTNRSLRGVNNAWRKEAPRVFDEIKSEIGKPLNRSYSIEQIDAELAKRGGAAP